MQHKMLISRIKCFMSKIRSKFIGYHYQRIEILGLRTFMTRNIFLILMTTITRRIKTNAVASARITYTARMGVGREDVNCREGR